MNPRQKYLYLTKKEWVYPWVNGGEAPINLASTYKKDFHDGIYTKDENILRHLQGTSEGAINALVKDESNGRANITLDVKEVVIGGQVVGRNVLYHQSSQDGLILSFCNHFNPKTAQRLKKQACVQLNDVYALLEQINGQLGVKGIAQSCAYTKTFKRNHFLKGNNDSWQDEFRLFWNVLESRNVIIWPGTAIEVKL